MATESTPVLGTPELALAPHARLGRQVSVVAALLFMFGFHGAMVLNAWLDWEVACDVPLAPWLMSFGLLGLKGTSLYLWIELSRGGEQQLLLPSGVRPQTRPLVGQKVLIALLVVGTVVAGCMGLLLLEVSDTCRVSSPRVYNWSFAAALAFCVFGGLVLLVPLLSLTLPLLAAALSHVVAALAALVQWMHEAGRRRALSATGTVGRLFRGAPEEPAVVASPTSSFALYVNTTALAWFFAYFLVEVGRERGAPCDAPLASFVSAFAWTGLVLTVADFLRQAFADPMPPLTKLEQTQARDATRRRMAMAAWLGGAVLVWGVFGAVAVHSSRSCGRTSPQVYRLSLLLVAAFYLLAALAALAGLVLGIDFCCSGKLRMIVVFEE